MSTTQGQISNVFNLLAQLDLRINNYHFGQRWDIERNVYNNFDPKNTTGRMFPAVMMDVPDKVTGLGEPQYLSNEEEIDMLLYFDTLQDKKNDGSLVTDNLIEQWDALKIIAEDYMANFAVAIGAEKYNISSIVGDVEYTQRESQHSDRLLTWEVSFKLKHQTPCTDETYQVNLDALPATIPLADIERTDSGLILTPCELIIAAMSPATRSCVLKDYNFEAGFDTDFESFEPAQIADLEPRICIPAPTAYFNNFSMRFNGIDQDIETPFDSSFDFGNNDKYTLRCQIIRNGPDMYLFSKYDAGFKGYLLRIQNGFIWFYFTNTNNTNQIQVRSSLVCPLLSCDIVITVDGTSTAAGVGMYIDGLPIATTIVRDSLTATTKSTDPLYHGSARHSSYFPGDLNIPRGWNFQMSDAEVLTEVSGDGGQVTFATFPLNLVIGNPCGDDGTAEGAPFGIDTITLKDESGKTEGSKYYNADPFSKIAAI